MIIIFRIYIMLQKQKKVSDEDTVLISRLHEHKKHAAYVDQLRWKSWKSYGDRTGVTPYEYGS